jgi:hypothetical protein
MHENSFIVKIIIIIIIIIKRVSSPFPFFNGEQAYCFWFHIIMSRAIILLLSKVENRHKYKREPSIFIKISTLQVNHGPTLLALSLLESNHQPFYLLNSFFRCSWPENLNSGYYWYFVNNCFLKYFYLNNIF